MLKNDRSAKRAIKNVDFDDIETKQKIHKILTEDEIGGIDFDLYCQIDDCPECCASEQKDNYYADIDDLDIPPQSSEIISECDTSDQEDSADIDDLDIPPQSGPFIKSRSLNNRLENKACSSIPKKKQDAKDKVKNARSQNKETPMKSKSKRKMEFEFMSDSSFESVEDFPTEAVSNYVEVPNTVAINNATTTPQIIHIPSDGANEAAKSVALLLMPQSAMPPPNKKKSSTGLTNNIPANCTGKDENKNVAFVLMPQMKEPNKTTATAVANNTVNFSVSNSNNITYLLLPQQPEQRMATASTGNISTNAAWRVNDSENPSALWMPKKSPATKSRMPIADIANMNQVVSAEVKAPETVTTPVATLVFFDLETTGLGHLIGACNVQITELSMVAISRDEFQKSSTPDLKDVRVVNKLSMCVKPRSSVSHGAAKITGLDDYKLKDQKHFDKDTAQMICTFLTRLPQPVCLLAHNGDRFDYPLLKAEFRRVNVNFPENLILADTLIGFRGFNCSDETAENKTPQGKAKGKRQSFSLENLHLQFFRRKPTSGHSSEGDCMALAKICHKVKDQFLPWVDRSENSFSSVVSMW